jgi:hypothetical protein
MAESTISDRLRANCSADDTWITSFSNSSVCEINWRWQRPVGPRLTAMPNLVCRQQGKYKIFRNLKENLNLKSPAQIFGTAFDLAYSCQSVASHFGQDVVRTWHEPALLLLAKESCKRNLSSRLSELDEQARLELSVIVSCLLLCKSTFSLQENDMSMICFRNLCNTSLIWNHSLLLCY